MKKSQLRNIIRESIKELIFEQNQGSTNAASNCIVRAFSPASSIHGQYCEIACQYQWSAMCCQNTNNQPFNAPSGFPWNLAGIENMSVPCAPNCQNSNEIPAGDLENIILSYSNQSLINPSSTYPSNFPGQNYWYGIWTGGTSHDCNNFMSNPPSPSGCNPSAWSNYTNWTNTWTNLGPFNSPNPNQPCNFICNKIQDFTNSLVGAGPVQTNILNCKLDVAQQQEQIHNCNC